jgi:hypothetical protein
MCLNTNLEQPVLRGLRRFLTREKQGSSGADVFSTSRQTLKSLYSIEKGKAADSDVLLLRPEARMAVPNRLDARQSQILSLMLTPIHLRNVHDCRHYCFPRMVCASAVQVKNPCRRTSPISPRQGPTESRRSLAVQDVDPFAGMESSFTWPTVLLLFMKNSG